MDLAPREYTMIARICRQLNLHRTTPDNVIDPGETYKFAIAADKSRDGTDISAERQEQQIAWERFIDRMVRLNVFDDWPERLITEQEMGIDTDYMRIRGDEMKALQHIHADDRYFQTMRLRSQNSNGSGISGNR